MELPSNIRVATWLGTEAIIYFQRSRSLNSCQLDAFTTYLLELVDAVSIPEWDRRARGLDLTGLGDPLPKELGGVSMLSELTSNVREISASQIYGTHEAKLVKNFLLEAIQISELPTTEYDLRTLRSFDCNDGWGDPISLSILEDCHRAP